MEQDSAPERVADARLAPVAAPSDVGRELGDFDGLDDEALASLLETHQRLARWYYFGGMAALSAGVAALWATGHHGWDHLLSFAYLICAGLGALGSRAFMRGEAKRMGLDEQGRAEFYRRLRQLQFRSTWTESRRRAKELRAVPREERLAVQVRHMRELSSD
jgi:hypothetical protein